MTDPLEPDTLPGETLVGTEHADVHFVYTLFPATPVALPGIVRLTNYRVAFVESGAATALWSLPLASIGAVEKQRAAAQTQSPSPDRWPVTLTGKGMAVATLAFATRAARHAFVAALRAAAFVQPARERLFAFCSREAYPCSAAAAGFGYDAAREFARQGALGPGAAATAAWRTTALNADYTLCPSYPRVLVVPAAAPDALVADAAAFRTRARVAVLTWLSPDGVPLARSSQPCRGARGARSAADAAYIDLFRTANPADQSVLLVADSRPRSAALANRARGGGTEDAGAYAHCRVAFADIPNIHAVRAAHTRLRALCQPDSEAAAVGDWPGALGATRWPATARLVLDGAAAIVASIAVRRQGVLCHCSDGWDRTAQCCALAQLCLDGHYRTLRGLACLLEKDWLAFGHKFEQRGAPGFATPSDQCAPVFAQFLCCVHALLAQFPTAFEYSARLLAFLDAHAHSARFATLLGDTDAQRAADRAAHPAAPALWDAVLAHRTAFLNPRYDAATARDVLHPDTRACALAPWDDHYLAWLRMHPCPTDPADAARRDARTRADAHDAHVRDVLLHALQSDADTTSSAVPEATLSSPSASPAGSSRKRHNHKTSKGDPTRKGDKHKKTKGNTADKKKR